MSKHFTVSAALVALGVLGSFSSAFGAGDEDFVKEAAKGGMMEVKLGKLAGDNASSDEVKQFGQRMVDDHTKANDELKAVAKGKNIDLPKQEDDKEAKEMSDTLSKLKGEDFDKAYMKHMVQDHEKDVASFEKESKDGADDEVKAFAAKTLPTLKEHLTMAKKVADQVGASTDAADPSAHKEGAMDSDKDAAKSDAGDKKSEDSKMEGSDQK